MAGKPLVSRRCCAESNNVGRETIQAFIGALHGIGAGEEAFITTSAFTPNGRTYARAIPIRAIPTRVIRSEWKRLVVLMIKYRVDVQVSQSYDVVDIGKDFCR